MTSIGAVFNNDFDCFELDCLRLNSIVLFFVQRGVCFCSYVLRVCSCCCCLFVCWLFVVFVSFFSELCSCFCLCSLLYCLVSCYHSCCLLVFLIYSPPVQFRSGCQLYIVIVIVIIIVICHFRHAYCHCCHGYCQFHCPRSFSSKIQQTNKQQKNNQQITKNK